MGTLTPEHGHQELGHGKLMEVQRHVQVLSLAPVLAPERGQGYLARPQRNRRRWSSAWRRSAWRDRDSLGGNGLSVARVASTSEWAVGNTSRNGPLPRHNSEQAKLRRTTGGVEEPRNSLHEFGLGMTPMRPYLPGMNIVYLWRKRCIWEGMRRGRLCILGWPRRGGGRGKGAGPAHALGWRRWGRGRGLRLHSPSLGPTARELSRSVGSAGVDRMK
jgi:hypothetical protein